MGEVSVALAKEAFLVCEGKKGKELIIHEQEGAHGHHHTNPSVNRMFIAEAAGNGSTKNIKGMG